MSAPAVGVPMHNGGATGTLIEINRHIQGKIVKVPASILSRYWAGNMHRPRAVQVEVTIARERAVTAWTAILAADNLQNLSEGSEAWVYVHRILVPDSVQDGQAVALRSRASQPGTTADAVLAAVSGPSNAYAAK